MEPTPSKLEDKIILGGKGVRHNSGTSKGDVKDVIGMTGRLIFSRPLALKLIRHT